KPSDNVPEPSQALAPASVPERVEEQRPRPLLLVPALRVAAKMADSIVAGLANKRAIRQRPASRSRPFLPATHVCFTMLEALVIVVRPRLAGVLRRTLRARLRCGRSRGRSWGRDRCFQRAQREKQRTHRVRMLVRAAGGE